MSKPQKMHPNPTAVDTHDDKRHHQQEQDNAEDLEATHIPRPQRLERPPAEPEGIKPLWKVYPPLSFSVLVLLVPASILGTLARLGLLAMTKYDGESIFPLAYVQALGCLIMGFGLRLKEPIGQFYGPFYTALTTGFCGSLTTFSSWQVDVFSSWLNIGDYHRSGFHSVRPFEIGDEPTFDFGGREQFIDGLGKTVFTLSLSLASVSFGYNIANLLAPHLPTFKFPSKPVRYAWSALAVCMYGAVFPAYFNMSPRFRHGATAALLFAFPGALTRYVLSIYLNQRIKALPVGTFTANALGTALLGAFRVIQSLPDPISPGACSLLQGLGDGYCGCLTTVSTFAAELRDMEWARAVCYAIISWGTGQLLLLVIVGPSMWAGGVGKSITCNYVYAE